MNGAHLRKKKTRRWWRRRQAPFQKAFPPLTFNGFNKQATLHIGDLKNKLSYVYTEGGDSITCRWWKDWWSSRTHTKTQKEEKHIRFFPSRHSTVKAFVSKCCYKCRKSRVVCYVPNCWTAGTPCHSEKRKSPTISWISLYWRWGGENPTQGSLSPFGVRNVTTEEFLQFHLEQREGKQI